LPFRPFANRSRTDPPETASAKFPRAATAAAAASTRAEARAAEREAGDPWIVAETSAVDASSPEAWYWNWCGVMSIPGPGEREREEGGREGRGKRKKA